MKAEFHLDVTHPVVRDHTVYGRYVLPGLAYIDLLYQFFRAHRHEATSLELRNLTIYQPVIVSSDSGVRLCVEATERANGAWKVSIRAAAPRRTTAPSSPQFASVEMHPVSGLAFDETIDLDEVTRSSQVVDLDDIYQQARSRQLVHSGFMKPSGRMYRHARAMHADIELGDEARRDAGRVMFHPALLDGAAVCAGVFAVESTDAYEPRLLLPLFYRRFRASSLIQHRCVARVETASIRRTRELTYVSVDFFDASHRKIAELESLVGKVVRDPMTLETDRAASASRWRARPLDVSSLPAPRPRGARETPRTDLERLLKRLVAERLDIDADAIDPRAGYYELGLTSAALLELVRAIERELTVELSPTVLFEHTSIAALASHLGNGAGAGFGSANAADEQAADDIVRARAPHVTVADSDRRMLARDIAVIGMAGRYPQARGLREYWDNLRRGVDCVTEIPAGRWDSSRDFDPRRGIPGTTYSKWGGFIDDVDRFDAPFFGMSPRDAELVEPQQRLFLETVWELLEGVGHTRRCLRERYRGRVGVYVGAMYHHYERIDGDTAQESATAVASYGAIANRVSHFFDLVGPSLAIDTMCSSSAIAIHVACKDLQQGECALAIAGGVNLSIHPKKYIGLSHLQMLSSQPDRRSFADGDGFVPAEGVGAVLLKPLARAMQDGDRVLAVIKATATNHQGRSSGFAVPNVTAERDLVEETLRAAAVDPRSVTYVEAAANGTALADAVEVAALSQAFGQFTSDRQFCAIGSVKSNVGHLEAASGVAQLTKVALQFGHGELVPSIKTEPANPDIRFDDTPFYLQRTSSAWPRPVLRDDAGEHEHPRRALILSFGAGGSNAGMLIEEPAAPEREPSTDLPSARAEVIVLSARTPERLNVAARRLRDYLHDHAAISLRDLAYTLQRGREAMESRLAFVASSIGEVMGSLDSYVEAAVAGGTSSALYTGAASRSATAVKGLASGAAGDTFIRLLVAERDLDKLALLWASGVEVPWELLHGTGEARFVPLPTYPFDRQRCWLPRRAAEATTAGSPIAHDAAAPIAMDNVAAETPAVGGDGEAPRTALEHAIASVWEDVLGLIGIGVRDTFLSLGGSSLAAGRVIARLRDRFGVDVPLEAFVRSRSTVESLAVEVVAALAKMPDAIPDPQLQHTLDV